VVPRQNLYVFVNYDFLANCCSDSTDVAVHGHGERRRASSLEALDGPYLITRLQAWYEWELNLYKAAGGYDLDVIGTLRSRE
jgi:hypothetical protein